MLRVPFNSPLEFKTALRFGAVLTVLFLALAWVPAAYGHTGDTYQVQMTDSGFVPDKLEIIAGDTVVFENVGQQDHWPASNFHPTHRMYPDFDPQKPILPGDSWSFIFFRPGVWGFHDHEFPDFTGEIVVLPDTHAVGPGQTDGSAASGGETGLARIVAAIRRYVSTIFDAARQLVAEVFGGSTAVAAAPEPTELPELDTDFRPPPVASFDQVYRDLQTTCAIDDFDCWADFVRKETISFGPGIAVDLVLNLKDNGQMAPAVDEHQLGHQIGRQTAESFGVNEQAFLLCPMSTLNGGCQHGFFEYVLGRANSTSEAADVICQQLRDGYAPKDYFYCYHGVGHGVMMAAAYDLDRALSICDSLEADVAQDGCWQGVFMENVNAGMGGFAAEGVFSELDPLAPCSVLDEQYKHECYINHAGWLARFFDGDVAAASAACAAATDGFSSSCLESIGLMVSNPVWQETLYGDMSGKSFEQVAWELCTQFPAGRVESCILGAIDNIHNFDIFEIDRAAAFCDAVDEQYQELCYRRMGLNLTNQIVELEAVIEICNSIESDYRTACLSGAGVDS